MKNKLTAGILKFAETSLGNSIELFEYAKDYYNHYKALNVEGCEKLEFAKTDKDGNVLTFEQKEAKMNAKLREAVCRLAGVSDTSVFENPQMFASHPVLGWATFAVIEQITDMIIPDSLIASLGAYTEIRTIGYGDSMAFNFQPRDLFAVSKAGRKKAQGELKRQFDGQVVLNPENHQVSVYVDLYRVMANLESLAKFMMKVARSIETAMATEVYVALDTAMQGLPTDAVTGLQLTGWNNEKAIGLVQKVTAFNQGRKALYIGTQLALAKILPTDANYRYLLDSDYVKLGYVRTIGGIDTLVLPQVADWTTPFKTLLDDNHIYVISPSSDKLVKLVIGGSTLSNVSQTFTNANLIQTGTMNKQWAIGVHSSSVAGLITLA